MYITPDDERAFSTRPRPRFNVEREQRTGVQPERYFARNSDETLVKFWNDGEGAITWLDALEAELQRRGYITRDDSDEYRGERRILTVDGEPL